MLFYIEDFAHLAVNQIVTLHAEIEAVKRHRLLQPEATDTVGTATAYDKELIIRNPHDSVGILERRCDGITIDRPLRIGFTQNRFNRSD